MNEVLSEPDLSKLLQLSFAEGWLNLAMNRLLASFINQGGELFKSNKKRTEKKDENNSDKDKQEKIGKKLFAATMKSTGGTSSVQNLYPHYESIDESVEDTTCATECEITMPVDNSFKNILEYISLQTKKEFLKNLSSTNDLGIKKQVIKINNGHEFLSEIKNMRKGTLTFLIEEFSSSIHSFLRNNPLNLSCSLPKQLLVFVTTVQHYQIKLDESVLQRLAETIQEIQEKYQWLSSNYLQSILLKLVELYLDLVKEYPVFGLRFVKFIQNDNKTATKPPNKYLLTSLKYLLNKPDASVQDRIMVRTLALQILQERYIPSCSYQFNVNNRNTRKTVKYVQIVKYVHCKICSNLTINTPQRRQRRSGVFIVIVENISYLLVFLLLTSNRKMFAGSFFQVDAFFNVSSATELFSKFIFKSFTMIEKKYWRIPIFQGRGSEGGNVSGK